jgi:hypothetical protein
MPGARATRVDPAAIDRSAPPQDARIRDDTLNGFLTGRITVLALLGARLVVLFAVHCLSYALVCLRDSPRQRAATCKCLRPQAAEAVVVKPEDEEKMMRALTGSDQLLNSAVMVLTASFSSTLRAALEANVCFTVRPPRSARPVRP